MRRGRLVGTLAAGWLMAGAAGVAAAPVTVTPLPGSPYTRSPYKDRIARGAGEGPSTVALGQLNADQRLDAVSFGSLLRTMLAPADPLTAPFAEGVFGETASALTVADADNDGDQDLVVVSGASVSTLANSGSGTFSRLGYTSVPANTSGVVGSFNGDAYPDAVLVTAAGRQLVPGTADGRFTGTPVSIEGTGAPAPTQQAAGDTDGDGDQDVVGAGPGFVRVLRNNGGGAFTALAATTVTGTPVAVIAADFDEDGKADPVVLMDDGRVLVVRSRGGVTDAASGLTASPGGVGAVRAADLDGDQHLDVLAGNAVAGSGLHVLSGNGAGGFCGQQTLAAPAVNVSGLAVGDLTGDGLADVAVASGSGYRTDLLRNTTAVASTDAQIVLPYKGVWVSEAPFTATLGGQATDVEWDFGDGRTWSETDLGDPDCATFVPDPNGPVHAYGAVFAPKSAFTPKPDSPFDPAITEGVAPGIDLSIPPEAPKDGSQSEVRRTYLVRARFTTPSGAKAIVARTVVVRPDTPPKPIVTAAAPPLNYRGATAFGDESLDADDILATGEEAGRDRIIREQWDFKDGSPVISQAPGPITHDFFATRLAGRAPLTAFAPVGAGAVEQANSIAAQAAALNAAGPANWTGDQKVGVSVTDRSGRTGTKEFTFRRKARIAPRPALAVSGAVPGVKVSAQKLLDPIIVGKPITLDLRPTRSDPNGALAFHILRIGLPSPAPCPALSKSCVGGKPPNLTSTTAALGKPGAGFPTVVISDAQLAKQKGKVDITFPKSSAADKPFSVQDTVYDETGAVGRTRYDGFVVEKKDAACVPIQGKEVGPANLVFSGSCVDTHDDKRLFTSRDPITLDGLKVRPAAGKVAVVAACGGKGRVYVVNALPAGATCKQAVKDESSSGDLEVLSGDDVVATLPSGLQSLTTKAKADGRVLFLPAADRYRGFPLRKTVRLTFASAKGKGQAKATLDFQVLFPDVLSPAGKANTGKTTVITYDVPKQVIVTEFDGYGLKTPKARVAAAPPAPKIAPPSTLQLGPLDLKDLGPFTYDAGTDTFTAKADGVPLPTGGSASLAVVLKGGNLVRASGDVGGLIIPITPLINLTGFGFVIEPAADGLILQGTAKFGDTTGQILTGSGTVTSRLSSNFALDITGRGTIVHLLPVQASLGYSGGGVKFSAGTGASFGPVSFSAQLNGGFAQNGFQISGNGRACLFACLKITGLASERGIAGCGSVDLVLTTITAGFGYLFGGGVNAFVGSCNLSPYGSAAVSRRARAAGPDGSYAIPLRPVSNAISLSVGAAGPLRAGAVPQVQVFDGNTLIAQTTSELGATSTTGNVPDPSPESGLQAAHVFVDQDAGAGVAKFLIPEPKGGFKGPYTVKPAPGAGAIAEPVVNYGDPPIGTAVASASIDTLTDEQRKAVVAKQLPILGLHPSDPAKTGSPVAGAKVSAPGTVAPESLGPEELDRLRFLTVTGVLPPGQTMTFKEFGISTEHEIGTVKADETTGKFAFAAVFAPTSYYDLGLQHCITGFVQTADGLPRGEIGGKDDGMDVPPVVCFPNKPISAKQPSVKFKITPKGPGKVMVDVTGIDVTGWRQFAVLQIAKGDVIRSVTLSANTIADLQGQKLTRRAAAAAPPVAKRSFAFPISGLPKGKAPVRVTVSGVPDPLEPGKVSRVKSTLKAGQRGLQLTTKGAKVKHLKKKKAKPHKGAKKHKKHRKRK